MISGRKFYNLRKEGNLVKIDMDCLASNPCLVLGEYFMKVDFRGTLAYDPSARKVSFRGYVEPFPNFEMYATYNDGAGQRVFRRAHTAGPSRIPGAANQYVSGSVQFG